MKTVYKETHFSSGTQRLLIYETNRLSCPVSYGTDEDCDRIINKILDAHPPIHASLNQSLVRFRKKSTGYVQGNLPANIVSFYAYADHLIPDKVSLYADEESPKFNILAIRNDEITDPPGAFPLRKGFPYRNRLDSAIIALQLAFNVTDFTK